MLTFAVLAFLHESPAIHAHFLPEDFLVDAQPVHHVVCLHVELFVVKLLQELFSFSRRYPSQLEISDCAHE